MLNNLLWFALGCLIGAGAMYVFKPFVDDQLKKLRKKNKG